MGSSHVRRDDAVEDEDVVNVLERTDACEYSVSAAGRIFSLSGGRRTRRERRDD